MPIFDNNNRHTDSDNYRNDSPHKHVAHKQQGNMSIYHFTWSWNGQWGGGRYVIDIKKSTQSWSSIGTIMLLPQCQLSNSGGYRRRFQVNYQRTVNKVLRKPNCIYIACDILCQLHVIFYNINFMTQAIAYWIPLISIQTNFNVIFLKI